MSRRTLPFLLILGLLCGWGATAATAAPQLNPYQRMVLELIETQRIDPCHFSTKELKTAKAYIPLDAYQYNGPLIAALDDAISARAQGACNKRSGQTSGGTTVTPPPSTGGQTPPPPQAPGTTAQPSAQTPATPGQPLPAQAPPTPKAEPTPAPAIVAGNDIALASNITEIAPETPFPMLALAILLGVLALCTLAFGIVRFFAWEPAWAVRFRHAAGEAGWRASSTWSDFADYVRLGR